MRATVRGPIGRFVCSAIAIAIAICMLALAAGPAGAAPHPGTLRESPVHSVAPDARVVPESFVRVYAPLPPEARPHPADCDWLSYLRFRHRGGPANPSKADAIDVISPGGNGGASSIDQLARDTVRDAAAKDRDIEVWALDRRSNCLEDTTGTDAAYKAKDPTIAYDYYYGGKEVDGKKFAGFVSPADAQWLYDMGLAQTVRDWYDVMRYAIPDPKVRRQKVICGAHSLGGPILAALADWDFDGDTNTRGDAGFNQCAGLVALDTSIEIRSISPIESPSAAVISAANNPALPYTDTPPLTPAAIQVASIFGVGAFVDPNGTDLIDDLPDDPDVTLATRLLFSRNAVNFATGMPSVRDFNVTNEAALGGVFDDNSDPVFALRSSIGLFTGGPLAQKNFPVEDPTMAIPAETSTPLYSWQHYDDVGRDGASIPTNDAGQPFTSRGSEISDITQLARTMFEAPANFIEQYFPTAILNDINRASRGDRSGDLSGLKYENGANRRSQLVLKAGDSANNGGPTGPPTVGEPPNGRRLSKRLILNGYNHLDVLTAARRQNDGRPEAASTNLARYTLKVAPRPAITLRAGKTGGSAKGASGMVSFHAARFPRECRAGVLIEVGRHRARTDRRGRATIRVGGLGDGERIAKATKPGCRADRIRVGHR